LHHIIVHRHCREKRFGAHDAQQQQQQQQRSRSQVVVMSHCKLQVQLRMDNNHRRRNG